MANPESKAGRKALAKQGKALSDDSYPVPNLAYLKKAIRAKGRTPPAKWPALKRLLLKRARELGAQNAAGVKGTWIYQTSREYVVGQTIDLAGPYRYRHGWIKLGSDAEQHLKSMHQSLARSITGHLDAAFSAHQAGDHGTADDHLHAALRNAIQASPGRTREGGLIDTIRKARARLATEPTPSQQRMQAAARGGVGRMMGMSRPMDLAGAQPVAGSSDGPRITKMAGAGKATSAASQKLGLQPHQTRAYAKLRKKNMPHALAMRFAKRVKRPKGAPAASKMGTAALSRPMQLASTNQGSALLPQSAGKYTNWYTVNTGRRPSTNQSSALLPMSAGKNSGGRGGLNTGSQLTRLSAGSRFTSTAGQTSRVAGPGLNAQVQLPTNLHPKIVAAYNRLRKRGMAHGPALRIARQTMAGTTRTVTSGRDASASM